MISDDQAAVVAVSVADADAAQDADRRGGAPSLTHFLDGCR